MKAIVKIRDNLTPKLTKKQISLDDVPQLAYKFFKNHTPIKTGNARKRTLFAKDTIQARYPYAQNLDQGASQQAPDGMTKPTLAYVKSLTDKILKRK